MLRAGGPRAGERVRAVALKALLHNQDTLMLNHVDRSQGGCHVALRGAETKNDNETSSRADSKVLQVPGDGCKHRGRTQCP